LFSQAFTEPTRRSSAAIAETIGQDVDYRPVEPDGAARAAALIAPLLEESKGRKPAPRPRRPATATRTDRPDTFGG
jgi:hypothetical protein